MTTKAYQGVSTRQTPQSEPIPGRPMVQNSAGGFVYAVDDWARLDRFLILGTESPTYYVGQKQITRDNADCVARCIKADGIRTVNRIVEISESGRAPKNDPALFALAMCISLGDVETKRLATGELARVARIGTHLFHFVAFAQQFRGWGRLLSAAVKDWYTQWSPDKLAYQVVKYQSRDGWSHRDLLRLAHPKSAVLDPVYRWVVKGQAEEPIAAGMRIDDIGKRDAPAIIQAFEKAKKATTAKEIISAIREQNLPRECVPTERLTDPAVWDALLEKMPMTAMIRNLATMTRVGLIAAMSEAAKKVAGELRDVERLKKARIHPIAVLAALKTYAQGHGERGKHTWEPVPQVIDALNDAFYLAFANVQATGRRFYLGCDVSGSMWCGDIAGIPGLTPGTATGALAMVTAKTEPQYCAAAFNTRMVPFSLSPKQRLDDVCKMMKALPWGGTNCALPMLDALERKIPVDVFIIYTDNETWAGRMHPSQALQQYRQKMGIGAKCVVVGMTATEFSIANPDDGGMMDVVGFDASVPQLIRDFVL